MSNYKWKISDGYPKWNGYTVFSCFPCGGGSTMGYKLNGYKVLGGVEIDKQVAKNYVLNHKPKHFYRQDIRDFIKWVEESALDIPKELFSLDVLDGSPPCSSFSMAGSREDGWGEKKKFREGQAEQTLDDLFFDFIKLGSLLKPKVVVSENVTGLLMGNAKDYFRNIIKGFDQAGYLSNHYVLDSSRMGVPQRRNRVFIISVRKDICDKYFEGHFPIIDMGFHEKEITFQEATREFWGKSRKMLTETGLKYYDEVKEGHSFQEAAKGNLFNWIKVSRFQACPTLTTAVHTMLHPILPGTLNKEEYSVCGSYPLDYKTTDKMDVRYLIGMSVPPLMMKGVSQRVKEYVLDKIN